MIAKDSLVYAQQGKRKTLQRKDLGKCCKEILKVLRKYIHSHRALKWVYGVIVVRLMGVEQDVTI